MIKTELQELLIKRRTILDNYIENKVSPYIKFRDINNGQDTDKNNRPKTGVEIGLKWSF